MTWRVRKRAEQLAFADKQEAVTRCNHCGRVIFRGLVRDGKALFKSHRERCQKVAA